MAARRRGQGGLVTVPTHAADEEGLRAAVRDVWSEYPAEYWRGLEPDRYPDAFVKAMTEAGLLAVLIPAEDGGSGPGLEQAAGILGGGNAARGEGGARPPAKETKGDALRARRRGAKEGR